MPTRDRSDAYSLTLYRQIAIAAVLLFVGTRPASAERLIVTRDGRSIWAVTATREGDSIVYVGRDSREEKRISASSLAAVIPVARRGKAYAKDDVRKYIARIEGIQQKYPNLMKQLRPLLDDWRIRLEPPPDLGKEIAAIVRTYEQGGSRYAGYRAALVSLDMLSFKDPAAAFAEQIKETRSELTTNCFDRLVIHCNQLACKTVPTVDEFAQYRAFVEQAGRVDRVRAKKLVAEVGPLRRRVLDGNRRNAFDAFTAAPTLDNFLRSLGLLSRLELEIASSDSETDELQAAQQRLHGMRKEADPDRWFSDDGFPMVPEDWGLNKEMKGYGNFVTFRNLKSDRECYMIATSRIRTIRYARPVELSYRLIFNKLHAGAEYGVVVRIYDQTGPHEHVLPLDRMVIKDGRADVTVREDFSKIPDDFEPVPSRSGDVYLYTYIAYRREGKHGPEWRAISPARSCVLLVPERDRP